MTAVALWSYWRGAPSLSASRAASFPPHPPRASSSHGRARATNQPGALPVHRVFRSRRLSSQEAHVILMASGAKTSHVNELIAESPAFGLKATPVSRAGRFGLGELVARHGPVPELPCWALEAGSRSGRRLRGPGHGRGPRGTSPRTGPLGLGEGTASHRCPDPIREDPLRPTPARANPWEGSR